MSRWRMRQAREVLEDPLWLSRTDGSLDEDLERNFAPDVVMLTASGIQHGHADMRELARQLYHDLPDAESVMTACWSRVTWAFYLGGGTRGPAERESRAARTPTSSGIEAHRGPDHRVHGGAKTLNYSSQYTNVSYNPASMNTVPARGVVRRRQARTPRRYRPWPAASPTGIRDANTSSGVVMPSAKTAG